MIYISNNDVFSRKSILKFETVDCVTGSAIDRTIGVLEQLAPQAPDSLLALIGLYKSDPRVNKIDVGVGVYRNTDGNTPIFAAIKAAEKLLIDQQHTKSYLGPEGDVGFFERLTSVVFGARDFQARLTGLQTPGGTGALRLASELIATAKPRARIFVGTPTWPNHLPILTAAGLEISTYKHFDISTQTVCFENLLSAVSTAERGDAILLQGSCNNPAGADLDAAQWTTLADKIAERGLLPLIDLAYQGLGAGLDADALGTQIVFDRVGEALLAYSCDKNFGLYRERTGALFALSCSASAAPITQSNLLALARANWSMPPDHGAAAVRLILESESLSAQWRAELEQMRHQIVEIRNSLASLDPWFEPLRHQQGMFSMLLLNPQQIQVLREQHGIYMAGSGRINLAGLTLKTVGPFAAAIASVR
jgi:aromatic-amino-acid transaminase